MITKRGTTSVAGPPSRVDLEAAPSSNRLSIIGVLLLETVGAPRLNEAMTDHRVLEAMRAAHAALDLLTVCDEAGQPTGWVSMDDMSPAELGQAVRLQA